VHAFELAGASAERVHVNRLLERPPLVRELQILCIPGGFSYGDDIAAGRIFAERLRQLADGLREFHEAGGLVLGICNGFQVLLKTELLLPGGTAAPRATLTWNDSGRFEARWVSLGVATGWSVFLKGLETLELPVAHAEGKFVTADDATLDGLEQNGQLVLRYRPRCDAGQLPRDASGPASYPNNPNGAYRDVAGVCDSTGRVLGLMPHPERFVAPTQHPQWTRRKSLTREGDGLKIFQNSVDYFKK
jgi:phosphoribosylformylglycinamidine synthase